MRWDDVYLRACATRLPAVMPAEEAVARGLVDAVSVRRMQSTGVTVGEQSPPDMAVAAARTALGRSGVVPDDIALLLHASLYHQGYDMWAPASYVQRLGVGNRCPAMEVRQTSNGGMAALELAAAHLTATGAPAAMITTADRFCAPGIDRWRTDPGTVLADGATATVVARGRGFARLVSLVLVSEPGLEEMHRGEDPPGDAPLAVRCPVDFEATTRVYLRTAEGQRSVARMANAQTETIERALEEAKAQQADIDWFVLPHLGRRRLDVNFFRRYGIDPERTLWSWSRGIGHLGAGDQFAGLTHLVESGRARAGARALLLGVGGGFTWSAAVVEFTDVPAWPASAAAQADL
ncbi:ketoacyl-ACP synthase III family protein [Streptomyces pristinaespiralis]|uniref:CosE protein n=2 Tax=Streptomyces pristinaespiralis TaxID=38300 RepID=B5HIU8_STRE2|nr:ketoacyl-ACP synthase III family protein [Streptomyces pristinaespiralis]ALC18570.1 3-oxoacyl-ACP synthase [Streptomyces pristinaespiralis]ALC25395.1 3-oxoacyl-ACP synthase [Streptomyces pristinaespiralis]EDY66759.1 CosE protein [Streptomyces pristinaespiralis ATCC 25486]CBW45713.1 putative 3-oxoacyl-ACP synthase III [Streptomyces pristinaespiralis]